MEQMTREEIQKRMDELARKYVETHNSEIPQKLYLLARELEKIEKLKSIENKNRKRKSQYGYKLQGA